MSVLWEIDPDLLDKAGMTATEFIEAYYELVQDGIVTETVPATSEHGPRFALAFWPLSEPEKFSTEVRRRHEENMKKWAGVRPEDLTAPRH